MGKSADGRVASHLCEGAESLLVLMPHSEDRAAGRPDRSDAGLPGLPSPSVGAIGRIESSFWSP